MIYLLEEWALQVDNSRTIYHFTQISAASKIAYSPSSYLFFFFKYIILWPLKKYILYCVNVIHTTFVMLTYQRHLLTTSMDALQNLARSSMSSGYFLPSVLWILWIQACYSFYIVFFAYYIGSMWFRIQPISKCS